MREMFRKFQMILSMALGSVPVAVLVFMWLEPRLLSMAWIYPVTLCVFSMISAFVPSKVRLLYGMVISAATIALTVLYADQNTWIPLLMAAVCYLALFLWSLTVFGWRPDRELPELMQLIGCTVHLIAQFAVSMDKAKAQPLLTAQAPILHGAFVCFLLLLPFAMNRGSINKASTKTRQVPNGMRKKNTWMTLVLVALACAVSFIPYIYEGMKAAVLWLVAMLMGLLSWETSEPHTAPTTPPVESAEGAIPIVEAEKGPFAELLELILLVLGGILIVGIVVCFAVLCIRKMVKWMGKVWTMLEGYASAVAEDYEDEITDIREESLAQRIDRHRSIALWRKEQIPTDPGENIRYRYRRLLRKHPQWTANTTARENMPEYLAKIYEKARYSDHVMTESESQQFQKGSADLK